MKHLLMAPREDKSLKKETETKPNKANSTSTTTTEHIIYIWEEKKSRDIIVTKIAWRIYVKYYIYIVNEERTNHPEGRS